MEQPLEIMARASCGAKETWRRQVTKKRRKRRRDCWLNVFSFFFVEPSKYSWKRSPGIMDGPHFECSLNDVEGLRLQNTWVSECPSRLDDDTNGSLAFFLPIVDQPGGKRNFGQCSLLFHDSWHCLTCFLRWVSKHGLKCSWIPLNTLVLRVGWIGPAVKHICFTAGVLSLYTTGLYTCICFSLCSL